MKNNAAVTMLIVFDSSKARFYHLNPRGKIAFLKEVRSGIGHSNRDVASDKPGRSFSSGSAGRSAIEPKHDPHKQEKHNFVHELAGLLDAAYDRNEFRELVVAAPERSIGELRGMLSEKIKKSVRQEVPKDLLHYGDDEIEARVRPLLGPLEP